MDNATDTTAMLASVVEMIVRLLERQVKAPSNAMPIQITILRRTEPQRYRPLLERNRNLHRMARCHPIHHRSLSLEQHSDTERGDITSTRTSLRMAPHRRNETQGLNRMESSYENGIGPALFVSPVGLPFPAARGKTRRLRTRLQRIKRGEYTPHGPPQGAPTLLGVW